MTSQNFIIEKINQLVDTFPTIQIRYQSDKESHIVEVLPKEMILNEIEEFEEAMNAIFLEFDAQFQEDLMFVTEGDYVGVKKLTYAKVGKKFDRPVSSAVHLDKGNLEILVSFYESLKSGSGYVNEAPTITPNEEPSISVGEPHYAMAA